MKLTENEMLKFVDNEVIVAYDGKKFHGIVDDIFYPHRPEHIVRGLTPGFIIKNADKNSNDDEFKHIKSHRIESINLV